MAARSKFKAVLFDFDGTLAKTMEDHFASWKHAMSAHGVTIKPEDYYPLEGLRVFELPQRFFEMYGVKLSDEAEVVRRKEEHYLAHHHFELYPGVNHLIQALRDQKVFVGVVTAGLKDRLNNSAPAEFLNQFDAIVTGDDTKEGKPSAEPYLKAAEKLNVKPAECIVVENAPLGIESAKKAGAYCIALCSTVKEARLKAADEILGSFDELKNAARVRQLLGTNGVSSSSSH